MIARITLLSSSLRSKCSIRLVPQVGRPPVDLPASSAPRSRTDPLRRLVQRARPKASQLHAPPIQLLPAVARTGVSSGSGSSLANGRRHHFPGFSDDVWRRARRSRTRGPGPPPVRRRNMRRRREVERPVPAEFLRQILVLSASAATDPTAELPRHSDIDGPPSNLVRLVAAGRSRRQREPPGRALQFATGS
jgi:hypothetical protein